MKRLLFILSLITILTASGCMNAVVSEDSPSDTEIAAETPNTAVPSIMIDGELYYTTGTDIPIEVDPSVIKTAKVIDSKKLPESDGEINFPVPDAKYALINDTETYVVVMIDHEWVKFARREDEADPEVIRLEEKISELMTRNSVLETTNKEYLGFIDGALDYLDEDALKKLSQSLYSYTLTVNNEVIPFNGILELENGPIKIEFTEEMLTSIRLPQVLYDEGTLSGDHYSDHLVFTDQEAVNLEITDGTVIQSFLYTFDEETPVDGLRFEITEELKDRLGIGTTSIEITVRK